MSLSAHRAPKLITRRKATAVAVVGLSAGSVALLPSSSQAATSAQAKARYQNDLATSESAGQIYDQQEQAYAELQKKIDGLQDEIGEQNRQITALDSTIGLMAAQQYRNGGVSATLELALAASPDTYLDKAAGQQEVASQEAEQLRSAAADETELRQENALAASLVQRQGQSLQAAKSALARANDATASAKALLASLTPAARAQVTAGSGAPGSGTRYSGTLPVPSGRAAAAVAYAESKVGDVYVTGGNGPDEFDCSGLTQEAWKAAGVYIERTTYEQWDSLPHIPASALEPGDLVFFNWNPALDGPGHVALYVGDGMYIQATHPGSDVQWASLDPNSPSYGDMPIVGYARVG